MPAKYQIVAFLRHCRIHHAGASIMLAQQYLPVAEKQGRSEARAALRWWFRAAKAEKRKIAAGAPLPANGAEGAAPRPPAGMSGAAGGDKPAALPDRAAVGRSGHRPTGAPPPWAANDLGGADWERDLVRECRERGFLWRTEQTYRDWARRFAAWLAPRAPYVAIKDDVGAFLSHLAVTRRASASTQKQALNAVVFLLQEALHRTVGEIDFQRARPGRRVPTVLSGTSAADSGAAGRHPPVDGGTRVRFRSAADGAAAAAGASPRLGAPPAARPHREGPRKGLRPTRFLHSLGGATHHMFYVYVLHSGGDEGLYIGFSSDLRRRLCEHQGGASPATSHRGPWRLIYHEAYVEEPDARGREKFLKSGSGRTYIKKQCQHYFAAHPLRSAT